MREDLCTRWNGWRLKRDKIRAKMNSITIAICMVVPLLCSVSACAQSPISASPMHSSTPHLQFPHVTGLTDSSTQQAVNSILADREREDIDVLNGCRRGKVGRRGSDGDSETVRVTYLSHSFLSLDVRLTVWQCAPYHQLAIPHPLTINLRTGEEADWEKFFLPGFLPVRDFSVDAKPRIDTASRLTALYLSRYKQDDAQCVEAVKQDHLYGFDLWLDSVRSALVAIPNFPHVIRACADEVAIPLTEVLPYVADPKVADELARYREDGRE